MARIKNPLIVCGSVEPPTPTPTNIYEEISYFADKGEAEDKYPVGTMIDVNTGQIVISEITDHLTMRIVGHNGIIQEEDGTQKQNRPQLLAVRVLKDARAFGSAQTTAQTQWNNCTLRTWMNGTYLSTLPEDFRNAVKTTVVTTCPNGSTVAYTTLDKLWLPSAIEVGGMGSGATYKEGIRFPYFGTGSASNDSSALNNMRVAYDPSGSARSWWLRSAGQGGTSVWGVYAAGGLSNFIPTFTSYVRPACNL